MFVRYEMYDDIEREEEMYNYPCAIRLTEDGDDTYEVFTYDDKGNYVRIPKARIIIDVVPTKNGTIWEKVTPEHWDSFGKDLPRP